MNEERPMLPPKARSLKLKSELPQALPPRDYDRETFNTQPKVTSTAEYVTQDGRVPKLVQQYQELIIKNKNTEPVCHNNPSVFKPPCNKELEHIHDEVSLRSSASGSCSARIDEQWSDSEFDSDTDYDTVAFDVVDPSDRPAKSERHKSHLENTVDELLEKELTYIDGLMNGIRNFIPLLDRVILPEGLQGQRNNLFANIEKIHKFHRDIFLPVLLNCDQNVKKIAECFIDCIATDEFYCYVNYALNRRKADSIFERHREYFSPNQMEMVSFLLLPIQQLPRYKMFLEKLRKEILKFEKDYYVISTANSINRALVMISQINDLINAAVSVSHIPECESEFAAASSISESYAGFNRENDQTLVLILKPEGNKQSSRNNPINLFDQGKFTQVLEEDIYDEALYRWYKARFFVFEKLVIYTEIVKDTFPYRGHYFNSEINYWTDHKKLHLCCLQRGTQEILMRYNQSIEDTVKAIRQRIALQLSTESDTVELPEPTKVIFKPDLDIENSITKIINSQIKFVKIFRENIEFHLEVDANRQGTQYRTFKEICFNMLQQHERIASDLSSNVNNMSGICTMFLQYIRVDFPSVYGEYLKIVCYAGKFIRNRITANNVNVLKMDDFFYLCIERLDDFTFFFTTLIENLSEMSTRNVSFEKTLFQELAVVQVQLEKFSQRVDDNFRLLCLDDGIASSGLALTSEQVMIKSDQLLNTDCRIFICERAVVCVSCSFESRITKRSERFDGVVFFDKFSGRHEPMRLTKNKKDKDMVYFTIERTKYKVKFKTNQIRDKFHANYVQQYASVGK